jgi:hypothetical protein
VRQSPDGAPKLPKSPAEIADVLVTSRAILEAGGVFPAAMMTLVMDALRA